MAQTTPVARRAAAPADSTSRTLIEICKGKDCTIYACERLAESESPTWRLSKLFGAGSDASTDACDVSHDAGRWVCTCLGFEHWHRRKPDFACKHVRQSAGPDASSRSNHATECRPRAFS